MSRWISLAAIAVVFAGCSSPAPAPKTPTTAPAGETVRFAWPAPASVKVTELIVMSVKPDRPTRMSYVVDIAREGDNLLISQRDFVILEAFGGGPCTGDCQEALDALVAMLSARPTLVVAPNGRVTEVRGIEAMIEKALEMALMGTEPENHADVRAAFADPSTREQMIDDVKEPWLIWVGFWLDELPSAGEQGDYERPSMNLSLNLRHEGTTAGVTRYVYKNLSYPDMDRIREEMGLPPDFPEERMINISYERSGWIETTATLQPRRIVDNDIVRMTPPGGAPLDRVETHDYTFSW